MQKKWYFIVVVVLAFIGGVFTQDQTSTPNQEILLQFTDNEVSLDEAEVTIESITQQLETAGVANIKVTPFSNGTLKITYHSIADVSDIKNILDQEESFTLEEKLPSETPTKEPRVAFDFDVYEIQPSSNSEVDLQGTTSSPTSKGSQDRLVQPNPFARFTINEFDFHNQILDHSFKAYAQVSFYVEYNSYEIPEVRAGPIA